MASKIQFNGFPREAVAFYAELKQNNTKEWFAANKSRFDQFIMASARDFVYDMGKRLSSVAPNLIADPRVDKSIFRVFRDTRFSKDKSPYKTHLGIFFWEGSRPKMECSGFYFHLEPPFLMLAAGMHCMPKTMLPAFRESVVHPVHGGKLVEAIQAVEKSGAEIGGTHYKKVPRGFDAAHPNAAYLLHDGLYASVGMDIPEAFFSEELIDYAYDRFAGMSPLHRWLVDFTERVEP
jgi:uncharacterized protein (TIGR02453 family)